MTDPAQSNKNFHIYQQMFELNPEPMFYLNLTGKVVMANYQVRLVTGYAEDEFIGKSVFDLPFFLPETVSGLKQKFLERLKGHQIPPYDVPVRAKDGHTLIGQVLGTICKSAIGIPVGVIIIVRDVTAERTAIASLDESEHFSKLLFQNMLNGIAYCKMLKDEKGNPVDFEYLEVNKSFDRIVGVSGVAGKRATEVFPTIKKDHPELFTIYGRVAETGVAEHIDFEFKPIRKWLSISVYSPAKGYFVAVFDDITERKQHEQMLKERVEKSDELNKLVVGREIKMVELKSKVAKLEKTIELIGKGIDADRT